MNLHPSLKKESFADGHPKYPLMPNAKELAALHIMERNTCGSNTQSAEDDIDKSIECLAECFEVSDTYLYNLKQNMIRKLRSRSRSVDAVPQCTSSHSSFEAITSRKYYSDTGDGFSQVERNLDSNQNIFKLTRITNQKSAKTEVREQEVVRNGRLNLNAETDGLRRKAERET